MVILTSDSCGTLLGLDEDKRSASDADFASLADLGDNYIETALDYQDNLNDDRTKRLFLPISGASDECIKHIPDIVERCDDFLSRYPVVFNKDSKERIIYVGQREVAHAVSSQCDVIVTDRATTCHMLALRSTSSESLPLTSMTHIDDTSYESCIRNMIFEHLAHHTNATIAEEKKEERVDSLVTLDVHIVGGFEDEKKLSSKIANWLFRLLAEVAADLIDSMKMVIKTCAVSSLNDDGYQSPMARGMAIDLHSGYVYMAKADQSILGPMKELREARLWSEKHCLSVMHDSSSNGLVIEPFDYAPLPGMEMLLKVPDDVLLKLMSTSPNVEEEDFCSALRSTLRFLVETPSSSIFGPSLGNVLVFHRSKPSSNTWKRSV